MSIHLPVKKVDFGKLAFYKPPAGKSKSFHIGSDILIHLKDLYNYICLFSRIWFSTPYRTKIKKREKFFTAGDLNSWISINFLSGAVVCIYNASMSH